MIYRKTSHGVWTVSCWGILAIGVTTFLIAPSSATAQCPAPGNCCTPHPTPGCENASCCTTVCGSSPECCFDQWFPHCANFAQVDCGPGGCSPGGSGTIPPGDDCLTTPCGDTSVTFCNNPLPENFFGPTSKPFDGIIRLGGRDSLIPDTFMTRLQPMNLDNIGDTDSTPIQLTQLDLVSCEPIEVLINHLPTLWDVEVTLNPDALPPPPGLMEVRKTHDNGGTFDASFNVLPRFTFTEVGNPSNVRVFDAPIPDFLSTVVSAPWVHDTGGEISPVCGVNFVPGIQPQPEPPLNTAAHLCCTDVCHNGATATHCIKHTVCAPCPHGACCNPADGSCAVVDEVDCMGEYKGHGTTCSDRDGDGIADILETNSCCDPYRNECRTGTDPNNPDTDGDGLLDGDELRNKCDPCVPDSVVGPDGDPICGFQHYVKFSQPPVATSDTEDYPSNLDWVDMVPNQVVADDFISDGRPITAVRWWGSVRTKPSEKLGNDVLSGVDLWHTPAGASYQDFTGTPIPAGFFDDGTLPDGSDAFTDTVNFEGVPLGAMPSLGQTDTIVERLSDAAMPNCPDTTAVPIIIRALSLQSVSPMVVTYNGGLNPELWDVRVFLAVGPQVPGNMTIQQQCMGGGIYNATLPVHWRAIFTRQGDGAVRVFDTIVQGLAPTMFTSAGNWVYQPDPVFGAIQAFPGTQVDTDGDNAFDIVIAGSSNFYPGFEQTSCTSCKEPQGPQNKPPLTPEQAMWAAHGVNPANKASCTGPPGSPCGGAPQCACFPRPGGTTSNCADMNTCFGQMCFSDAQCHDGQKCFLEWLGPGTGCCANNCSETSQNNSTELEGGDEATDSNGAAVPKHVVTEPTIEQAALQLLPRAPIVKPLRTTVNANIHRTEVIWVKFKDGLNIRSRNGALTDLGTGALQGMGANLAAPFAGKWERAHSLAEKRLDQLRTNAERNSGKAMADLNLEFHLFLPEGIDAAGAIDALNALDIVELAVPVTVPPPPPGPPSFEGNQGYLNPATGGIDARGMWQIPGGTGVKVSIADLEYSWNLAHVDLPPVTLLGPAPNDPFSDVCNGGARNGMICCPGVGGNCNNTTGLCVGGTNNGLACCPGGICNESDNHGTAVLGEMAGLRDGQGVTGIAYDSTFYVVAVNTGPGGGVYNVGGAITTALGTLTAGDVILIEQQTAGPNYTGIPAGTQFGLVPSEWTLGTYTAIQTAIGNGVIVVEAAGNGSQDLDNPKFNVGHAPFLPANDSGAIIVGAGAPPGHPNGDRSRLGFSNYGSTVDLQGWGSQVYTTGYGDAYSAQGKDAWYTATFGGTSSASPIVAGACATLQSAHKVNTGLLLTPAQVKASLQSTGSPQLAGTNPVTQNIGPRPNTTAAFALKVPNAIDGWLISFHEHLQKNDPVDTPLALYFCDPKIIEVDSTELPDCQAHKVLEYFVNLDRCCLVHARADYRSGHWPAKKGAFYEEKGVDYHIDIQAVVGHKYVQDKETGECVEYATGHYAFNDFWGWHTTPINNYLKTALETMVGMGPLGEWLYGPWLNVTPKCAFPNMSFELLTNIPTPYCKEKCCQCPPGSHWIDGCGSGNDQLKSRATVVIDTNPLSCVGNTTLVLDGPVIVEKIGPLDDSVRYPGTRLNDLHLDVIDTEIRSMTLVGGGVILRAGEGMGQGAPLKRSYGVIAEQPLNSFVADSFFDVFFEVDLGGGNYYYNHNPHRLGTPITCVPPNEVYQSTLCLPLFDRPRGNPNAVHVANLVSAQHDPFADPVCGNGVIEAGEQCDPPGSIGQCPGGAACNPNCTCPPPVTVNTIVWDPAENPGPWPNNNPEAATRALRFRVTGPATPIKLDAIKVTMVDLQTPIPPNNPMFPPPNFHAWDIGIPANCASCTGEICPANATAQGGCARWVGRPSTFYETQGPPLSGPYRASRLQCTPFYWDWKSEPGGLVTVVGAEVLPSSQYSVQAYASSCMGGEAACTDVSAPVTMYTRRFGDVDAEYNPPSATNQPNAIDVAQVVNKFKNLVGSPSHYRAQLQPNLPDLNASINALDIVSVVDATKSFAYPFIGPCVCPSTVTCGGSCAGCTGMCVRTCVGGDNAGEPCFNSNHCPAGSCSLIGTCRDRCGRCN